MKRILIVGATSAIAAACARIWAAQGAAFFLAGRDPDKLTLTAGDLIARGARAAETHVLDVRQIRGHGSMVRACLEEFKEIDIALIAFGTLPDPVASEQNVELTVEEFTLNATVTIALLALLAKQMERQRGGTLAVITSVAGERGRASNYLYGSAKAAVSTFCEGLRARLFKAGAHLVDIRPGFVATPMTARLSLPAPLVAQPDAVAKCMVSGIERRVDVLYAPAFWVWIMRIIRAIPGSIFKRLSL